MQRFYNENDEVAVVYANSSGYGWFTYGLTEIMAFHPWLVNQILNKTQDQISQSDYGSFKRILETEKFNLELIETLFPPVCPRLALKWMPPRTIVDIIQYEDGSEDVKMVKYNSMLIT